MPNRILLVIISLLCAITAYSNVSSGYDFMVDDIYYKITSPTTCKVHFESYRIVTGGYYDPVSNYSGNMVIPEKVSFNGTEYSVNEIDSNAFYYCKKLVSVVIPSSITTGTITFKVPDRYSGCMLDDIISFSPCKITISNSDKYGRKFNLYASEEVLSGVYNSLVTEIPLFKTVKSSKLKTVSIKVTDICNLISFNGFNLDNHEVTYDNELYTFSGLKWDTEYKPKAICSYNGKDYEVTVSVKTNKIYCYIQGYTNQTSFNGHILYASDNTLTPDEVGLTSGEPVDNNGNFNLSGLTPNSKYSLRPYGIYDGERILGDTYELNTRGFSPKIELISSAPNEISLKAKISIYDATVGDEYFSVTDTDYPGRELTLSKTEPSTDYTITYTIKALEGGMPETAILKVHTPDVVFDNNSPKIVSETEAIVSSTTNLADEESGAGFEWRKIDAPDVVPSKEGNARIYQNVMEGRIISLNPNTYYKVRPFYKSKLGNISYGEWIGFDTGDFSYYEPIIHTYPIEPSFISGTSVILKGYVVQGTDIIIRQGFEFYPENSDAAKAKRIEAKNNSNPSIILATGQVMTATLEDLLPDTNYNVRAFVETSSGTFFGEEQTFRTETTTGINAVTADMMYEEIECYYDIHGIRHAYPLPGLNFIRYTSGRIEKVYLR